MSSDWSKDSKINDGIFVAYEDKTSRLWKYDAVRNSLDLAKEFGPHSDHVKNNVYQGKSNTLVTCCRVINQNETECKILMFNALRMGQLKSGIRVQANWSTICVVILTAW